MLSYLIEICLYKNQKLSYSQINSNEIWCILTPYNALQKCPWFWLEAYINFLYIFYLINSCNISPSLWFVYVFYPICSDICQNLYLILLLLLADTLHNVCIFISCCYDNVLLFGITKYKHYVHFFWYSVSLKRHRIPI